MNQPSGLDRGDCVVLSCRNSRLVEITDYKGMSATASVVPVIVANNSILWSVNVKMDWSI